MRHSIGVAGVVIIGVLGRLVPHGPNVTPFTSLSLFVAPRLSRIGALLAVFVTMAISDLLLAVMLRYPVIGYFTLFNYTGLMGITLVGSKFRCTRSNFVLYVLIASFSFWIWTNFGVWLTSDLYPRTLKGLGFCYYMALPFLRNALLGDLIWSCIIFGLARVAELGRRAGFRFQ